MKSILVKILSAFLLIFLNFKKIETSNFKFWLVTCPNCLTALNPCMNCYGETSCKRCITSVQPSCSKCGDDIFDENNLESIGNQKYFLCDLSDEFQVKACHIYCRGNYEDLGTCVRIGNIPACQCNKKTSSLIQTTEYIETPTLTQTTE